VAETDHRRESQEIGRFTEEKLMLDKPRERQIDIYDGTKQIANEIAALNVLHAKYFGPAKPFYWTKVHDDPKVSAPSGWYQWTDSGLKYLGETVLEEVGDAKP
jgi:hypothetical protein